MGESIDAIPTAREFDSYTAKKVSAGRIKPAFFMSNFLFLYMLFYVIVLYNKDHGDVSMNLHITKSKNAESFYICRSYTKANGTRSSQLRYLSPTHIMD